MNSTDRRRICIHRLYSSTWRSWDGNSWPRDLLSKLARTQTSSNVNPNLAIFLEASVMYWLPRLLLCYLLYGLVTYDKPHYHLASQYNIGLYGLISALFLIDKATSTSFSTDWTRLRSLSNGLSSIFVYTFAEGLLILGNCLHLKRLLQPHKLYTSIFWICIDRGVRIA